MLRAGFEPTSARLQGEASPSKFTERKHFQIVKEQKPSPENKKPRVFRSRGFLKSGPVT